jgi:hypothetical protein
MKYLPLLIAVPLMVAQMWAAAPETKPFKDGEKENFSTAGNPKAAGLDLTMSYPKGWQALETEDPNMVKRFVSPAGVVVGLTILPMEIEGTDEDRKIFENKEALEALIPPGMKMIAAFPAKINGKLAGYVRFSKTEGTKNAESVTYAILIGKNLVTVNGVVGAPVDAKVSASERMEDYKELFMYMTESIKEVERKER